MLRCSRLGSLSPFLKNGPCVRLSVSRISQNEISEIIHAFYLDLLVLPDATVRVNRLIFCRSRFFEIFSKMATTIFFQLHVYG